MAVTQNPNDFQKTLNLAARVIEAEALIFYEEAAEIMPLSYETADTKEEWVQYNQTRGRAHSLRKLATTIRSIKQ